MARHCNAGARLSRKRAPGHAPGEHDFVAGRTETVIAAARSSDQETP
jgi:hypothetical protein